MASSAQTDLQEWQVTEPYVDLHCQLGEGPYFEKATNTLRFVDIKQKRIHTVSLREGPDSLKTLQLDVAATVTADVEGYNPQDKLLVGIKYGLALLDRKTGKYEYLTKFADGDEGERADERIRSNDGEVDPHGRFWLGTMTDFDLGPFKPEGSLFRFDQGKTRAVTRTGLTIPNSIGWSPDDKTMYFTHSSARQVFAWDYDTASGGLSNERVWYRHEGPGEPDGFRVDRDGNVWHAVYGESRVLKLSPEGKLIGQVKLPTKNITCCEFVGTELFITSAEDDEGEGESKRYGGGLFRVDVGTTGLAHREFKLAK
ncbi:regucalcin [Bombardia bombarda]|uniref:Regucalcin n=1 Tax=Bombardia bombarda TaxID=252184 RepID=A0AA39XBD3_9PEZI|nr:regucalcin [Bombardia bombarda]